MDVTIIRYPDRRELTKGFVQPLKDAEIVTYTNLTDKEFEEIMEAKAEDVQRILENYV